MAFFIFPQAWITAAIAAAASAFGPVPHAEQIHVKYRNLDGLSSRKPPDKILIDKLPAAQWPREKAQCVLVFQYGRLAGRKVSSNPKSIMYSTLTYPVCHRWLVRHGIR